MSYNDTEDTGIPTRAIHEGYLDMQRARKEYREAKDIGDGRGLDQAHGAVQEAVLTFYELLRPHLRQDPSIQAWWDGELPHYPGDGSPPDPDEGKAVLQVQTHARDVEFDQQHRQRIQTDGGLPESLTGWHDFLGLNGNTRIIGVQGIGEGVFLRTHRYQLGLRHLDDWQTEFVTEQQTLDGFYGSKTEETTRRERVDMVRLQRAARELADVAARLGALSEFDGTTPRTEITEETMDKVKEWQNQNL